MDKGSIWYQFDRDSPGWIATKRSKEEQISVEDVARIVEANSDQVNDPLLREYILKGLRGELRGKPGRPANGFSHLMRVFLARDLVREKIAERKAANATRRKRGDRGLSEAVHEEVARMMRMGTGRSLANAISSLKSHWLFGE